MMATRPTILIVDDEPAVVRSLQELLRLDYRVLGATRAAEGIRLLDTEDVHVIVSDEHMPEMTGVEFLRRARGEHPDVIRLLFTGYADIRAVIAAINQGSIYRYVTKPCDPEELMTIIREAADRYDLVAERKRLLAELQAKNQELQQANRELQQSNALKQAFIEVASHELRTPLAILLGLCGLADRAPGLAPLPRDWIARMQKNTDRMARLVEQITNMLSTGDFRRRLNLEECGLPALLAGCVEDIRPFADLRHQALVLDVAADLGTIRADGAKIRDVLHHLLLNAVKFTPDAGRITLTGVRQGAAVLLEVRDTGIGIDAQSLPRIFHPFFTGFDVSKHSSGVFEYGRKGLGLGLGLSVVKVFVEMHGGTIGVQSPVGVGTTFTIRLPDDPPPPPPLPSAAATDPALCVTNN